MLSVIICTYNRKELLTRAIESALKQETQVPFEVVVTDDGSTDGTREHLRARFPKDLEAGRLRYFEFPHSGDPATGRNRGAKEAKGNFYAFLDSDDLWHAGRLASVQSFLGEKDLILETRGIPGLTTGGAGIPNENEKSSAPLSDPLRLFIWQNYGTLSSAVISRKLFLAVGGFPEGYFPGPSQKIFSGFEDYELWLKCLVYLKKNHAFDRVLLLENRYVAYEPQPAGLGDVRVRRQMYQEAMTLLRIAPGSPIEYWPLFLRRIAGATKAILIG
ncbi:MAG: glycosyltransferase family 2 protein [Bdellovibrio sp.]|nr:glycosyltransferase family 2 protein [Bdellovibrio sp.]